MEYINSSPATSVKSLKRLASEEYEDNDEINEPSEEAMTTSAKRFKSLELQSPGNSKPLVNVADLFKSNKKLSTLTMNVLSPITEITKHLSVANLRTPNSVKDRQMLNGFGVTPIEDANEENIPPGLKSFSFRLSDEEISEISTEMRSPSKSANNESSDKNYQMSARKARLSSDHPNGLLNMVVNELSFYGDESQSELHQGHPFVPSPPLLGLLSPESSPQRFQIFQNAGVSAPENKCQQNIQNQPSSTASSNTSAKSFRVFNSLSSCSMESSVDDDYIDLYEMETLEQPDESAHSSICFPSNLTSLISGHIKSSSPVKVEARSSEIHRPSVRRCLSMTENYQLNQPKTPELLKKAQETATSTTPFASRLSIEHNQVNNTTPVSINCFKRPEPPSSVNCSPVQNKRYRSIEKENFDNLLTVTNSITTSTTMQITYPTPLRKCISMNDADILTALARSESQDEPDLIGDFSKPYVLPLLDGRHRDLKSISSDTVARLINGEFNKEIASYKIIDCRYPYEYEGGHIRGAENLYTQEQIHEEFLTQQKTDLNQANVEASGARRNIIIFHCEFSSERGPKLSRFLRNNDRARNTNSYPMLDYPEIYLLHNGYKEFYETHAELCDPNSYRPMLEPAYSEAYRQFRSKSKSWNGDGISGTSRLKKSRSRLLL